jgi:hypothetical protein
MDAYLAEFLWYLRRGYVKRSLPRLSGERSQREQRLHRAVLGLEHGDPREGDHIDGNKLDCRRSNLRIVTHAQNVQNVSSYKGSLSCHRGVTWDKRAQRWVAQVMVNKKQHHLGRFIDEEEAARVASKFRLRMMTHTNEERALR